MKIIKRPPDQHYWAVRAESGTYYPNFKVGNVVAIGHIDHLKLRSEDGAFLPDKNELLISMLKHESQELGKSKASINNHYNQVIRFVYEIKIGDWVICPTSKNIFIGRVVGDAYISNKLIEVVTDSDTGASTKMRSNLRRDVVWGPAINRDTLPYVLNRAMKSHQAVFSLNDYKHLLYHLLYPCFFDDGQFHFSIKINQHEKIDNYSVSHLLTYLSEAEAASILIDEIDLSDEQDFDEGFLQLRKNRQLELKTKAQFMSEGDILGQLPFSADMLWFILLYAAIFGNKKLGFKGVYDIAKENELLQFFIKKWIDKGGETSAEQLQLGQPHYDTKLLEDHSKDKEQQRSHVEIIDLEKVFNEQMNPE